MGQNFTGEDNGSGNAFVGRYKRETAFGTGGDEKYICIYPDTGDYFRVVCQFFRCIPESPNSGYQFLLSLSAFDVDIDEGIFDSGGYCRTNSGKHCVVY